VLLAVRWVLGSERPFPICMGVLELARGVHCDLDVVLERVVGAARDLSGATYAALGVLDRSRTELEWFIIASVDEVTRRRIDTLPRGRGVLGELIANPVPLQVGDSGAHPHSYGFPAEHPRHCWGFR
jgi:hypothetical protein